MLSAREPRRLKHLEITCIHTFYWQSKRLLVVCCEARKCQNVISQGGFRPLTLIILVGN